jgi:hypothetical protein
VGIRWGEVTALSGPDGAAAFIGIGGDMRIIDDEVSPQPV